MDEKNRYKLGVRASTDLMMFRDWEAVAKDLENMVEGQICGVYTAYPGCFEGMGPKARVESYRDNLNKALGKRKDSYEMVVEESEEIEGGWRFSVRRV